MSPAGAAMAPRNLRPGIRRRKASNRIALGICLAALVLAALPLLWIIGYIIVRGLPALTPEFFTNDPTPVGVPGGGIANAIIGSAMTVGLAVVLAAPVGILVGLFVARSGRSKAANVIRFATDTIAGVPSIVMGIVAYALVVQPQGHFSAFSGGVVLSFIMVPIIIRTTEEMLRLVPASLREGALGLGAPDWVSMLRVVVPAAGNGILTGLLLAVARAAGEAAPMLFTAFGNSFSSTAYDQPVATLPQLVYVYGSSPYQDWIQKAWATGLVLIAIVLALNVSARGLVAWRARRLGTIR
jgi:phosphate transport system permease protein